VVLLALFGSGLLAALPAARSSSPEGAVELAENVQRIRRTTNFRASGRLVKVDGHGQRQAYQIEIHVTGAAGTTSSVYEVTGPESARMRIATESPRTGPPTVRSVSGGDKVLKDVPFANWRDAVLDSDLTLEDLLDDQFRWSRQSLGPAVQYGARQCRVLKSEPGAADRSHYSLVTSWLDETILHPVKVEKVARGSGVVKEFLYYGLRKSGGLWSASQIEVRTRGKAGSTFLIVTRGAAQKLSVAQ